MVAQQTSTPEKHLVKESAHEEPKPEAEIAQQKERREAEEAETKAQEREVYQRERKEAEEVETKAQEKEVERAKDRRDEKEKVHSETEALRLEIVRMEELEIVRTEEREVQEAKEEKARLEVRLAQMKVTKSQVVRHGRGPFRSGPYAWGSGGSDKDDSARGDDDMEGDRKM